MLPDVVLLAIFDFCVVEDRYTKSEIEAWQLLVHVCRQWRRVVFESPRRLNLRLFCSTNTQTPVRDTLDIWPALPLLIQGSTRQPGGLDNIIAALERSDRVYDITLGDFSRSLLEDVSTAMQKPFPELTFLLLDASEMATVIPDSFLGGSAPRLQGLWLERIPFPGLPKLLLSTTHLTDLSLRGIPHSGYFSPEEIVTALSTLVSLHSFWLEFQSPRSLPGQESRRPPPLTRLDLPVLDSLIFKGVSEYLEDLVARIDAPLLFTLGITLFNQIVFDTPQTIQFIGRTPGSKALGEARFVFEGDAAVVQLSSQIPTSKDAILVRIPCRQFDWQVSSLEQICTSWLPLIFALEDLYIYKDRYSPLACKDNMEHTLWLELFHPFTGVKNLYLSAEFSPSIAPALQELAGGRTTEVLPALKNIFLEGLQPPGPEGIVKFVAARQLSGHPITVSLWNR